VGKQLSLQSIGEDLLDSQEDKLQKSLLIFACSFMNLVVMLWLAVYWFMGLNFSSNVPLAYQAISISSLAYFYKTRNFAPFRFIQLTLFLFAPFVMQWSIGNSVTSSGVMLWALLAPIGALVVSGWKDSIPWFIAYLSLTFVSGAFDFMLGDTTVTKVPMKTIGVFFALNFAAMSSIVYFLVRYFVLETEKIKNELDQQHTLLEEEQKKSERILLNVLPANIAERLKNNPGLIADGYADVTVMFADLVNFTQLTQQMSPEQMVGILNTVFTWFDALTERHGLEKIKTIGDAYMVVGGLARERENYVADMANLAFDMMDFVASHPALVRRNLGLHIGISTGPVVAGVIGTKRFNFDLWGDTVNVSSRLTDDAPEGYILTDKSTYNRLRLDYMFGPPIILNLKGKGEVTSYQLVGKQTAAQKNKSIAYLPRVGSESKSV
jgi:class 3 adenylate cyclase